MKQWFRYLFKTYFQSLGAAMFFTAIFALIFWLDINQIFIIVLFGSNGIFITRTILDYHDGKLDGYFEKG